MGEPGGSRVFKDGQLGPTLEPAVLNGNSIVCQEKPFGRLDDFRVAFQMEGE